MTAHLKNGTTIIKQTVDLESGEIIEQVINKSQYLANTKEEFWLMYASMIVILKQSTDVKMKLFAYLLESYASGVDFAMNNSLKIKIATDTGCKPRSLDSAFTWLISENIVVKTGTRLYKINPRHIFQGSTQERNKELKAILTLHCPSC